MEKKLTLNLLGELSYRVGDEKGFSLPSRKAEALLIYLIVEKNTAHTREKLFATLWPDMPERSARHNLRQALYQLRKAHANLIISERATVQLNPEASSQIDLQAVEERLDKTQVHYHSDIRACEPCRSNLEQAVRLYRGDFLANFYLDDSSPFEQWAQTHREAVRRRILAAFDTLVDITLLEKEYKQAQKYAARQLEIDELRESAHRGMMISLALGGRRAAALRQYDALVQLLQNELGASPSDETQRIYRLIINDELTPTLDSMLEASIVVLPFVNRSSDEENEYFSDGLTEEIIADLAKVRKLRVISSTTAMMFKNSEKNSQTIGKELNVHYLLEGSVRKAGRKVRITAQLINTLDDAHVWAEKYSGSLEDIFEIQETLSRKIVSALKVQLTPEESKLVEKNPAHPDAHDAYLKGRYHLNMATPQGFLKALEFFQKAVELDDQYALAYAGLATAYNYLGFAGFKASDVFPKAREAAKKAHQLDNLLAEAFIELGYMTTFYEWDWERAEKYIERAIELRPNSSQAHLTHHWFLFTQNRAEECWAAISKASELDPLSMIIHMNRPNYFQLIGDIERMLQYSLNTLELNPYAITALLNAGWAYMMMERFTEAADMFKTVVQLTGSGQKGQWAYALARSGQKKAAESVLEELLNPSEADFIRPLQIASAFIGLKQFDQAFAWLARAYEENASPLMAFIWVLPSSEPIREDPRFQALLKRLKFTFLPD